jgi:GNAT superfamily N-acetyltransferase
MPVREAAASDLAEVCSLIRELAEYEHLTDEVSFDPVDISRHLFGPDRVARATIAQVDSTTKAAAGFALWYPTFSTFLGVPGIWLEDLFIRPPFRGPGLGSELLDDLRQRTEGRLEWAVLDWNESALGFYRRLGARPVAGWTRYRLEPSGRP